MTRKMLVACGLSLVLAVPGLARAGEVRLSIKDGRVALVARDATLREILLEWERVGGTRIVNRDRVPGTRINLEFTDVPEDQALATLLRPIAGYMAARRVGPEGTGASGFSRIILMPGEASPIAYAASPPAQGGGGPGPANMGGPQGMGGARPGVQRRVLPDGRVVTVMDDQPPRMDEPDDAEDARPAGNPAGLMRPPFNAPQRTPQGQPAGDMPPAEGQPAQSAQQPAAPPLRAAPTAPPVTVTAPGVLPAAKPGGTPPPIKPPG